MYSGRLSLVGDLLQSLFREAYSLQKCLMELLDKTSLENSASEEEISNLVTGVSITVYFSPFTPKYILYNLLIPVKLVVTRQRNVSLDLLAGGFWGNQTLILYIPYSKGVKNVFSSAVIHSLLDICSVISNLDIALHANTWKFIIK